MRILSIVILSLWSFGIGYAQDTRFAKANELFGAEKYEEAVTAYAEILNSGVESGALYYNLGNAYYKSGKLPEAILNFERALLLSPHDKDIRYNLEMANLQITDKLDTVGEFFLVNWFNNFKNKTKSDTWALISIIAFVLSILGIGLFLFARKRALKQVSFSMAIVLFVISFLAFNFSASQKEKLTDRKSAIIFAPSISVKSSPSSGGTDLFILHEGTKVNILEQVSDWNRVVISDGNEGWIPASAIEII